jgi:hypothetical protein
VAYQYFEYPKHVYPDPERPKHYVVVNSEAEEELAMAGSAVVRDEDERKRLMALAEVKGVNVDGRWSLHRMKKTLSEAGHDPEADPFA